MVNTYTSKETLVFTENIELCYSCSFKLKVIEDVRAIAANFCYIVNLNTHSIFIRFCFIVFTWFFIFFRPNVTIIISGVAYINFAPEINIFYKKNPKKLLSYLEYSLYILWRLIKTFWNNAKNIERCLIACSIQFSIGKNS